ncbi:uncharacterized protein LY89DRAFT_728731 [Mollisia scopiformis]|uniref:BTB domain-containing protein n=1 Tax=Mollisia scopiformis TaxID=149040 RepID=A0A194XRC9_MOLSC|nr:uncharacterized protein LY89DRAFT_728731 [Mollisia scopiformis]KUJ22609.1 hypothetical protein LY89DRAFT_728731 [Mollisia scopiformis]
MSSSNIFRNVQRDESPDFTEPNAMVTLIAFDNGNEVRFTVHKANVWFYSPILNAALTGLFVEGQTQTYKFSEDFHPQTIKLLCQWLYKQELSIKQLKKDWANVKDPLYVMEAYKKEDMALAELWVLADKLLMPQLKNKVVDYIRDIALEYTALPLNTICQYV